MMSSDPCPSYLYPIIAARSLEPTPSLNLLVYFMTLAGSPDLDPGSHGMPMNLWCVSFDTECMTLNVHPFWKRGLYTQKKRIPKRCIPFGEEGRNSKKVYQNGTPGVLLTHMVPLFQRHTLFSIINIFMLKQYPCVTGASK